MDFGLVWYGKSASVFGRPSVAVAPHLCSPNDQHRPLRAAQSPKLCVAARSLLIFFGRIITGTEKFPASAVERLPAVDDITGSALETPSRFHKPRQSTPS